MEDVNMLFKIKILDLKFKKWNRIATVNNLKQIS